MLQREVRETILCVDDEEGVLAALRLQLGQRFGHECEIATALSGPEALELLDELESDGERIAVVIADQIMPGMKGVDLLEAVDRRSPTTTKILLTGQAGLDAVVDAINRAHLNHYIHKPWDEANLHLAVENLLRQYRLADENRTLIDTLSSKNQTLIEMNRELEAKVHERTHELAEANSRLAQLAVTDGLTGLYNHRHFHERLALEVERSGRNGLPLCLLMIDVDHFKHYNDQHGHPSGDEVLRQLARVLRRGTARDGPRRPLRRRGVRDRPGRDQQVHRGQARRAPARAHRRASVPRRGAPARRLRLGLDRPGDVPRRRDRLRQPDPRRRRQPVRRQARRPQPGGPGPGDRRAIGRPAGVAAGVEGPDRRRLRYGRRR